MRMSKRAFRTYGVILVGLSLIGCSQLTDRAGKADKDNKMKFFITSSNPGNGGNLGGLAGADQHCQSLATSAGAGDRTWRAYLSTQSIEKETAVNARDRIGTGPWHNAKGAIIARNIEELHGKNKLDKKTALTERGEEVKGRGDTPNMHDILTGSTPDGRAFPPEKDMTCRNWTSNNEGSAMTGHHDRIGLRDDEASRSWNSSHPSRGCSQAALRDTGGNGLLYCFAAQ